MNKLSNSAIYKKFTSFLFVFVIILFVLRLLGSFIDPDMWWHIRLGENLWNGQWVNTLTTTCNEYIWVNHSWLADVQIALVNNLSGIQGLSIFYSLVFVIGIIFSFLSLKHILKNLGLKLYRFNSLLFLTFYILILSSFIAIRPQVFTFLFFNILFYGLIRLYYSSNFSYVYLVPALLFFVLWVNIHGGFVIGIVMVGLFIIDAFIRFLTNTFSNNTTQASLLLKKLIFLIILELIFILASLINPFGLDLWREIFALVLGSNNAKYITEWRAIDIKNPFNLFYFILFISTLVLQIFNKSRSLVRLLILLVFGFLSFYSIRYILPISGIVLIIFFVEFGTTIKIISKDMIFKDRDIVRLINILKICLYAIFSVVAFMSAYIGVTFFISLNNLNNPEDFEMYPIKAKEYLLKNKEEYKNLQFYNTYVWGGYLGYSLTDFKWFIDGRMPEWKCGGKINGDLMLDYIEIEDLGSQWRETIKAHNIEVIIVRNSSIISNVIYEDINWREVYKDDLAVIYIKNNL